MLDELALYVTLEAMRSGSHVFSTVSRIGAAQRRWTGEFFTSQSSCSDQCMNRYPSETKNVNLAGRRVLVNTVKSAW